MEKTLVLIKPDSVSRALIGEFTSRFENKGLKLVANKMIQLDQKTLEEHYSHHVQKGFFPRLVEFMMMTPVVAQIWEGVEAVSVVRKMLGVTNSREALPGTIRGDFSNSFSNNLVHASEDLEQAQIEIARFFKSDEIFSYAKLEDIIYSDDER